MGEMQLVPAHEREPVAKALEEGPWLNAHRPPTGEDLRAAPTLIVRWRAGDLGAISALLRAEARAPGSGARLVGLHVPGHPAERREACVLDAVLREGLHAPIRHDPDGTLARRLGLPVSPSVAWLDREGRLAGRAARGPDARVWDHAAALSPAAASAAKRWPVRGAAPGPSELLYPQGLAMDGSRLAIADTGHHRVLLLGSEGDLLVVGDGAPGEADGPIERARFSRPRGLWLDGSTLVVADTGNGALRSVDLEAGRVGTLAPTHRLEPDEPRVRELGPAPWDVAGLPGDDDTVIASLAGHDALVRIDTADGSATPVIPPGEGRLLVQPAGVTADADRVYVAEPTRGAIRAIDPATGRLLTLATSRGTALEHPTALALDPSGALIVADPYAERLLRIDTADATIQPVDAAGLPAAWGPPRAIAAGQARLVTAGDDHRVRQRAPSNGTWGAIEIEPSLPPADAHIILDPVEAAPDATLELTLLAHAKAPGEIEPGAPEVRGPLEPRVVGEPQRDAEAITLEVDARLLSTGHGTVRWALEAPQGRSSTVWRLPVIVRPGADDPVAVQLSTRGR